MVYMQIINQRQWYERPGPSDRFSDGSAVVGRQPKLDPRATQTCLEITDVLTSRARKVGPALFWPVAFKCAFSSTMKGHIAPMLLGPTPSSRS